MEMVAEVGNCQKDRINSRLLRLKVNICRTMKGTVPVMTLVA